MGDGRALPQSVGTAMLPPQEASLVPSHPAALDAGGGRSGVGVGGLAGCSREGGMVGLGQVLPLRCFLSSR